jgi:hypothetical protein
MGRCRVGWIAALALFTAACTTGGPAEQADFDPEAEASRPAATATPEPCPARRPATATRKIRPLTHVQMVSDVLGYAVGDGVIAATADGQHWVEQYRGPEELIQVNAADGDHVWAVGRLELLGTVDGGRHWVHLSQPDGAILRRVQFATPLWGWGEGDGQLFRTANGGRSWERLDTPCGAEAACTDGESGWVASGQRVDRTADGGDSWLKSFQLPDPGAPNRLYVKELQCARPGAVWASFTGAEVADGRRPYVVFRGSTAGDWTAVVEEAVTGPEGVDAPPAGSYAPRLSALGPDQAMLLTYTPPRNPPAAVVLATDAGSRLDGGERPVTGMGSRAAASFRSPQLGWVVGRSAGDPDIGVILATADGGHTWQEQYRYEP